VWKRSGHAQIFHKSSELAIKDIPLPDGYKRDDISYVIGGYRWKALFLDRNGYLITNEGKNQYNVKSRKWVDYLPGQKVPYDCGSCHTTGFSWEGHQDGLEGLIGKWSFEGVQCEACHGPGALHASSSLKKDIKIDRNVCSQCHEVKPPDYIPLQGVFLAPYSEVNQLIKSKMKNLLCTDCHNPHSSAESSIKRTCETCHEKTSKEYKESYMSRVGVKCIDCHMPPAGFIAEGDEKIFQGDLMSHLFKIDHRKEYSVSTLDGKKINTGYLSVDYSCMRCHSVFENRQWATSFAMYAHRINVTTDIKIMRLQMVFASIGFFFALVAVLSALSLKNWLWPKANKKKMLSIHRHSTWITFAAYVFVSALCIYFHLPVDDPAKALGLGWFLIHPINGFTGLIIYGGKVLVVRKYKKGWASHGAVWGIALFVFWIIQYGTAILSFFKIIKA
jgi:protein-arginine kinase activator protein McsA